MRLPLVLLLLATAAGPAFGQGAVPQKCDSPEHRQFDFWVGSWTVTMKGQPAGQNEITLEEDGCVLHEHWTGSKGGTGQSFNFFTRETKRWRQVWIDNAGNPLDLSGEFADGKMVLGGSTPSAKGPVQQRITFFRNPDGTVRQLWESSADGGATWAASFDGLYRRR